MNLSESFSWCPAAAEARVQLTWDDNQRDLADATRGICLSGEDGGERISWQRASPLEGHL